jgi:hypothetical protein
MPRRLAHTAAVALTAIACGLGAAACGGGGGRSEDEQAAQARWQAGVPEWRNDMVGALNQLSLMLSSPQTVDDLHLGKPAAMARLARHEQSLESCAATIEGFGDAPGVLEAVRREALQACRALARGAELVRDGVAAWRAGIRSNRDINRANTALGNGQRRVARASSQLRQALAGDD